MREWMTDKDLSEYLQLPAIRIHKLIKDNQIPHYNRLGTPRFHKQEIDEWMKSGTFDSQDSQNEKEQFVYRGRPIKDYKLTASMVLLVPTAWSRLPEFIRKCIEVFKKMDRSYLLRNEFEALIDNFNDYLRVSCQLGLIDSIREGRNAHYIPTEYAEQIYEQDDEEAIRVIIKNCLLGIVKMGKEEIPQERHAIFLLWYFLKLKQKGVVPDESYFEKGRKVNSYPRIRFNFTKSLCNFLFKTDALKEQNFIQEWDQYLSPKQE
jgi:excisionase family DNA binding protein